MPYYESEDELAAQIRPTAKEVVEAFINKPNPSAGLNANPPAPPTLAPSAPEREARATPADEEAVKRAEALMKAVPAVALNYAKAIVVAAASPTQDAQVSSAPEVPLKPNQAEGTKLEQVPAVKPRKHEKPKKPMNPGEALGLSKVPLMDAETCVSPLPAPLKQPDEDEEEFGDETEEEEPSDALPAKGSGKKRRSRTTWKRPKIDAVSIDRILQIAEAYEDAEARAYFCSVYLTGGRTSEVLKMRVQDWWMVKNAEGGALARYRIVVLKRGDFPIRERDVLLANPTEKAIFQHVLNWVNEKRKEGRMDALLFRYSRRNAREVLHRAKVGGVRARIRYEGEIQDVLLTEFHPYPRWLRHCRATHLVTLYDFSQPELQFYFMAKTPGWGSWYVDLKAEHLTEKMARQFKRNGFSGEPPAPLER